jgi:hypothetical protein
MDRSMSVGFTRPSHRSRKKQTGSARAASLTDPRTERREVVAMMVLLLDFHRRTPADAPLHSLDSYAIAFDRLPQMVRELTNEPQPVSTRQIE